MSLLAAPWAALAWLGRQGTRAIAAVVFLAIVVPPLDAVFRPFVTEAIFALLCIAFVRVDTVDLRAHFKKPGLVLTATAWTSLVLPSLIGVGCLLTGTRRPLARSVSGDHAAGDCLADDGGAGICSRHGARCHSGSDDIGGQHGNHAADGAVVCLMSSSVRR